MATRHRFHPFLLALLITILAGSVSAQVTGLRTIGGDSPDYTSISAALDDLNLHGVGEGGVTFLIRDGVYDEPHNLIIRDLNSSAENPVVFRPDAGADVVINQTISEDFSWGFRVHNSDHVTFSGIPYGETEGIHLTVNGYRNADDDVFVFWISNGADHVTLANLHIESISDPIHDTGWSTPVYLSTYQVPSPEVGMDGFTVRGCEIVGGSTFGMYLDSEATPNHDINIVNNKIWDWQKYGINLNDQGRYANIEGNEIWQTFDHARSSVYGMSIGSGNMGTHIHGNWIHDLRHSEMSGPRGIFFRGNCSYTTIDNNIINLVPGLTANSSYGIYQTSGSGTDNQIHYNTVVIGGLDTRGTKSFCLYIAGSSTDLEVMNNLLLNERTGTEDFGTSYCALGIKTVASMAVCDYNLLSVGQDGLGDNSYVARIGSGSSAEFYNTLADLQNAPGYAPRDVHSIPGIPMLDPETLHLLPDSPCADAGTPLIAQGIVTDFDGDPRDVLTPDIGADEMLNASAVEIPQLATGPLTLEPAHPNPFNPLTNISFSLARSATVSVTIHDVRGHLVRRLASAAALDAGRHTMSWDGRDGAGRIMPSGAYFFRVQADDMFRSGRMLLHK